MEKTLKIIAAFLLLIAAIMAVLVISNVISLHEIPVTLAKLFRNDKAETSSEGTDPHVKVDDVENVLKDIADAINKVANNQEAMTSAVAQLTVNLDTSNETFHKEVIALLESKGLHCCCCKCSGANATETQAPVVTTCSHANTKYTIGDGVHYTKCASCGKVLATASCKYNSNGYCNTCGGYRKPAETQAPETTAPCNHSNTTLRASTSSTHVIVCKECNVTVKTVNCKYTNGYCNCGNACAHNSKYTEAAANGTHNLKCGICHLTIMHEKCIFVNGTCTCTNACAHANTNQRANDNDTHSVICTECDKVVNTVACSLNTGACTCGNICKHAKTNIVSNNNGTHAEKCVICNYTVKTVNCVYTNNACICGHIKVQTPVYCNLKYIAVEGRNVHGVRCLNHVNEQYEEACTLINNCCTKCGGYYSAANRIPTSGSNDSEIVPGSGNNDDIVPGSGNTSSKCNLRYVAIPGRDIHLVRCPEHVNEQYTESCTYQNGCCIKCAGAKQCDDDTVPGSGSSNDIVPGSGSNDDIVPGSGSNNDIVPGSNGNNDFGGFGNPF